MSVLGSWLLACATVGGNGGRLDFAAARAEGSVDGAWVGGTNVLGGYTVIEADLASSEGGMTGELRVPSENVSRLPIEAGAVTGHEVRFSFRSPFGRHDARGRRDGGMIFGRIEGSGLSGDFHLVPVQAVDAAVERARAGSYEERAGHRLLVVARGRGGLGWGETERLEDGALWIAGGSLYGHRGDTVFSDRSVRADPRVHEWAVFGPDGSIEWHPETRPVRFTRRADAAVRQEPVAFSNGAVELSGTLLLPAGAGPHPAVVLVHGSGPVERTNLLGLLRADLFLRNGIGVLVYDKRGAGGSSGDWETASVAELAGDAAAAVALLRGRPGVAEGAVGLAGHSQAGWVIPAAAGRSGADFLVVLSGGGVAPAEQEVYRARTEAEAAGLAGDDAARLMALKWRYAASGEGWQEYVAAVRSADPRIAALVEATTDRDPARWALVRSLADYDPVPDLRALRVPTLVIFGAEDDNVPTARAADVWRAAVPPSLLRIETIDGVGHALVGTREGIGSIFPTGFVDALGAWLSDRPWRGARRPAP